MMMKLLSTTLFLLLCLPSPTNADTALQSVREEEFKSHMDTWWWKNETNNAFAAFPSDVQPRLDNEWSIYKSDSFPLPLMRVFQTFPANVSLDRPWPLLKSINKRLYPVLWPRVHYHIEKGMDFGCRTEKNEPITTGHCHRHCIRKGRYCLPYTHDNEKFFGSGLVKEITRRLCMDTIYHAKDPRYVKYLEAFDQSNCLYQQETTLSNCSRTTLDKVGMKWSDLKTCVAEDKVDADEPHGALDRNIRQLDQRPHHKNRKTLPMVTIDKKLTKSLSTEHIFQDYCKAFPSYLQQPLACHVCKDCGNVRDCLWTLTCDGVAFDPKNVQADVLQASGEEMSHFEPEAHTEEPKETPQDGDSEKEVEEMDEETTVPAVEANANLESEEGDGKGGVLFWVFFFLLCPLLCGIVFAYYYSKFRHERARKLLSEIANGKYRDGLYRDHPNDDNDAPMGGRQPEEAHDFSVPGSVRDHSNDYRGRAKQLLNEINTAEERYRSSASGNDLLDDDDVEGQTSNDDMYQDQVPDGDIQVEDISMDEESEWVETKRGTGQSLAASSILC